MDDLDRFEQLVAIMDRLREPGGCPWDLEQDYSSLRGYLLEECHEVAEALDHGDPHALREELGDLLFQIVFLSRIATEEGRFTIQDVIRGIAQKMIRRHPHVFGSETAGTSEQVVRNWEKIKREEKSAALSGRSRRPFLDGIPRSLPALLKAQRLGAKAAQVGFDWEHPAQILDKVQEETTELGAEIARRDRDAVRGELGDLLFSLTMLARHLDIDAEAALEQTNIKFRRRFARIESELERRGMELEHAGQELLEQLWNLAKTEEDNRGGSVREP